MKGENWNGCFRKWLSTNKSWKYLSQNWPSIMNNWNYRAPDIHLLPEMVADIYTKHFPPVKNAWKYCYQILACNQKHLEIPLLPGKLGYTFWNQWPFPGAHGNTDLKHWPPIGNTLKYRATTRKPCEYRPHIGTLGNTFYKQWPIPSTLRNTDLKHWPLNQEGRSKSDHP